MYGSQFTKGYQGLGFQSLSSTEAYVLSTDGNLWLEGRPWGQVPPPHGHLDGNVAAFREQAMSTPCPRTEISDRAARFDPRREIR
jgi:hypothetical protein